MIMHIRTSRPSKKQKTGKEDDEGITVVIKEDITDYPATEKKKKIFFTVISQARL